MMFGLQARQIRKVLGKVSASCFSPGPWVRINQLSWEIVVKKSIGNLDGSHQDVRYISLGYLNSWLELVTLSELRGMVQK